MFNFKNMQIEELYELFIKSSGVCTDTRAITSGCIFFALKGGNFNGNEFAGKALESGASFAVVDEKEVVNGDNFILVDDVLKTLQKLANFHRKTLAIPIVGITGTNGKTTTKELINEVLKRKYITSATQGNLNNHIGVPLTLLSMNKSVEFGIVEMGANHMGEIEELCLIAEPDYGIITNVGKAHLEGFGSFEGVKKTKSELYRFIEKKKGVLFVNIDNSHLKEMLGVGSTIVKYGSSPDCLVQADSLFPSAFLQFSCNVKEERLEIKSNLVGSYNLENALAAICIGSYFGVLNREIVDAIQNYLPTNNRSQLVETEKNKVLFDAYNANPTSMMKALNNFISIPDANKTVILGEMKELGEDSLLEHQNVVSYLKSEYAGDVILVGEGYIHKDINLSGIKHFKNVEELITYLIANVIKDNFVLVKGSRSNKLERLKDVL